MEAAAAYNSYGSYGVGESGSGSGGWKDSGSWKDGGDKSGARRKEKKEPNIGVTVQGKWEKNQKWDKTAYNWDEWGGDGKGKQDENVNEKKNVKKREGSKDDGKKEKTEKMADAGAGAGAGEKKVKKTDASQGEKKKAKPKGAAGPTKKD